MNKTDWKIRRAVISDASQLAACMQAAYEVYTPRLAGGSLPPLQVDYAEEIKEYPVWIAESAGSLAAGLVLMPEADCLNIANIAVHPRFQGKGLGRVLMEFAEAEAKRQGYKQLRLATHVLLTENITLYLHLGWSEIGRDGLRVYLKKDLN